MTVAFKEFGPTSLDIEVAAWFQVPAGAEFQRCREEVLLEFMRVVEEAGTTFSTPPRTIQVVNQVRQ